MKYRLIREYYLMRNINSFWKKCGGYTLAEVVIVMLVIAVVAGVSIKITKAKLDNIVSYTYYTGYSTLRNVSGQMLADFKANDEEYTDVAIVKKSPNMFLIAINWINEHFETPAWAANVSTKLDQDDCMLGAVSCPALQHKCNFGDKGAVKHSAPAGCSNATVGYYYCCPNQPDGTLCGIDTCADDETLNPLTCKCIKLCNKECAADEALNLSTCTCEKKPCNKTCGANQTLDLNSCTCVDNPTPEPTPNTCSNQPSDEEIHNKLCQEQLQWHGYPSCSYSSVTCNSDGYRWSTDSCACVPETATLPRKGQNFCEKFVDYTNTKSNAEECNGDAIASNLTDFSDKKADIVLRNGLKLYNVHQNPAPLALLAGNTQGGSYDLADGTKVNVNEYGYTVYLDIDGEKGSSTLWEDVFPFYITMAGKVVPLYKTEGDEEYGGTSRHHLMTSVQKEVISNGYRKILWIKKSVPFKEGACSSGYINANTSYCKNGTAVPLDTNCSDGANSCILKHISPVKFF